MWSFEIQIGIDLKEQNYLQLLKFMPYSYLKGAYAVENTNQSVSVYEPDTEAHA